jgi:mevalonate kinase
MLFRNDGGLHFEPLELREIPPLVVAWGAEPGDTKEQVALVRNRRDEQPDLMDALFEQMDRIALQGADVLRRADYTELGSLIDVGHGLLNAIGVSTPTLETMVAIARSNGAAGAKLTGAGGGGSIVALCPDSGAEVAAALQAAGFHTINLSDE